MDEIKELGSVTAQTPQGMIQCLTIIGQVEDLADVLPLVLNLESLTVVALPMADLAGNVDVRQEVHLDLYNAVALG